MSPLKGFIISDIVFYVLHFHTFLSLCIFILSLCWHLPFVCAFIYLFHQIHWYVNCTYFKEPDSCSIWVIFESGSINYFISWKFFFLCILVWFIIFNYMLDLSRRIERLSSVGFMLQNGHTCSFRPLSVWWVQGGRPSQWIGSWAGLGLLLLSLQCITDFGGWPLLPGT